MFFFKVRLKPFARVNPYFVAQSLLTSIPHFTNIISSPYNKPVHGFSCLQLTVEETKAQKVS